MLFNSVLIFFNCAIDRTIYYTHLIGEHKRKIAPFVSELNFENSTNQLYFNYTTTILGVLYCPHFDFRVFTF